MTLCAVFIVVDLKPTAHDAPIVRQDAQNSYQTSTNKYGRNFNESNLSNNFDGSDNTLTNEEDRNDKISEFYGLGKYNNKYGQNGNSISDKNRFMSDMDVRANTLPSKPLSGVTGEKDFRLRSLPDHVQSMPALYHEQQSSSLQVPPSGQVTNSYMNLGPQSMQNGQIDNDQDQRKSAFRRLSSSNSLQRIPNSEGYHGNSHPDDHRGQSHSGDYNRSMNQPDQHQTDVKRLSSASSQLSQSRLQPQKQGSCVVC